MKKRKPKRQHRKPRPKSKSQFGKFAVVSRIRVTSWQIPVSVE